MLRKGLALPLRLATVFGFWCLPGLALRVVVVVVVVVFFGRDDMADNQGGGIRRTGLIRGRDRTLPLSNA